MNDVEARIAALLTEKLKTGIMHPGNTDKGTEPRPILLPFMSASGRPKEMNDLIDATARMLGEAVVSTIVTDGDCELVPKGEAGQLRVAAGTEGPGPNFVPVYCRCNGDTPLFVLTVTDPRAIVVDGMALLSGLQQRAVEHPHELLP